MPCRLAVLPLTTIPRTFVPSSSCSGPASGAFQVLWNEVEPQAAIATAAATTSPAFNVRIIVSPSWAGARPALGNSVRETVYPITPAPVFGPPRPTERRRSEDAARVASGRAPFCPIG
jgi:hypothetical protein